MFKFKKMLLYFLVMVVMSSFSQFQGHSNVYAGNVETVRDDKGVWFITGPKHVSLFDVFEAMGYAVASDRLWQMELYRRQANGRLAEIFGTDLLQTDIYMRTIGYSDAELQAGFNDLDGEIREVINGYVAGINRRIAEIYDDLSPLPFEFTALDIFPECWTSKDILAWVAILQRNFDSEALNLTQIENAALYQKLVTSFGYEAGSDMFEDLRWTNDPDAQTVIDSSSTVSMKKTESSPLKVKRASTPDFKKVAVNMTKNRDRVVNQLKKINAYVKMGSYAWAVAKDKTETGNPILYSGPQMGFSVPSIVLEGSIDAGGVKISGMLVPGIPVIIIGRTPHHAWSMQVGHAHTTDYYLESSEPENVILHRSETIRIAGEEEDFLLPIFRTSHGPVINPMPYNPETYDPNSAGPIISWKYSHWGYEFNSIKGFLALAKADSMDEFGEGIEHLALSQHFCYADRDGNIAYWMSGRDPVRYSGEWRLPQGFADVPLEWDSEELISRSTDRNAARGFYGGWNNKTHSGYDNCYNSSRNVYGPFHRAHVIYDYFDENLANNKKLSFDEIRHLALNIATTDSFGEGGNPWKFVSQDFTAAVSEAGLTPDRKDALKLLRKWDGHFVAGGETQWASGPDRADAWIIMDAWIREVIRLTFADELGDSQPIELLFNVLLHGLAGENSGIVNNYNWFQNADTGSPQTDGEIIVTALDTVLGNLGTPPWGINARGDIPYKHDMLGQVVHTMPFSSRSTYAYCVEYGQDGPVRIESMFPLGESGNIFMNSIGVLVFDDHFFSMTPLYDEFIHRSFPLFDD